MIDRSSRNLTATLRADRRENRRHSVRLCGLREGRHVIDHRRGLVTVYVCQLRWLAIDQKNGTILRRQKSVEADFRERLHDLFPPLNWLAIAPFAMSFLALRRRQERLSKATRLWWSLIEAFTFPLVNVRGLPLTLPSTRADRRS